MKSWEIISPNGEIRLMGEADQLVIFGVECETVDIVLLVQNIQGTVIVDRRHEVLIHDGQFWSELVLFFYVLRRW